MTIKTIVELDIPPHEVAAFQSDVDEYRELLRLEQAAEVAIDEDVDGSESWDVPDVAGIQDAMAQVAYRIADVVSACLRR